MAHSEHKQLAEYALTEDERLSTRKRGAILRPRRFTQTSKVVVKHVYVSLVRENASGQTVSVFDGMERQQWRREKCLEQLAKWLAVQLDTTGNTWQVKIPVNKRAVDMIEIFRSYGMDVYHSNTGRVFQQGNRQLMGEGRLKNAGKEVRKAFAASAATIEKMLTLYKYNLQMGERFPYVEFQSEREYSLSDLKSGLASEAIRVCSALQNAILECICTQVQFTDEHRLACSEHWAYCSKVHSPIPENELPISHKAFQDIVSTAIPSAERGYVQELFRLYNMAIVWRNYTLEQSNIRYCPQCEFFMKEFHCPNEKCHYCETIGAADKLPNDIPLNKLALNRGAITFCTVYEKSAIDRTNITIHRNESSITPKQEEHLPILDKIRLAEHSYSRRRSRMLIHAGRKQAFIDRCGRELTDIAKQNASVSGWSNYAEQKGS